MSKDLKFIATMFILGMGIDFISSSAFELLQGTNFGDRFIKPDYSVNEFIFWIGGVLQDLCFVIGLNRLFKDVKFLRLLTRFYLDIAVVDICYLIFSNPYILNRSKWQTIEITLIFFILHCLYFKLKKKH